MLRWQLGQPLDESQRVDRFRWVGQFIDRRGSSSGALRGACVVADRDDGEPSADRASIAERGDAPLCGKQRVLNEILGVGRSATLGEARPVEPR